VLFFILNFHLINCSSMVRDMLLLQVFYYSLVSIQHKTVLPTGVQPFSTGFLQLFSIYNKDFLFHAASSSSVLILVAAKRACFYNKSSYKRMQNILMRYSSDEAFWVHVPRFLLPIMVYMIIFSDWLLFDLIMLYPHKRDFISTPNLFFNFIS
jgi:hypothetical protein